MRAQKFESEFIHDGAISRRASCASYEDYVAHRKAELNIALSHGLMLERD